MSLNDYMTFSWLGWGMAAALVSRAEAAETPAGQATPRVRRTHAAPAREPAASPGEAPVRQQSIRLDSR